MYTQQTCLFDLARVDARARSQPASSPCVKKIAAYLFPDSLGRGAILFGDSILKCRSRCTGIAGGSDLHEISCGASRAYRVEMGSERAADLVCSLPARPGLPGSRLHLAQ